MYMSFFVFNQVRSRGRRPSNEHLLWRNLTNENNCCMLGVSENETAQYDWLRIEYHKLVDDLIRLANGNKKRVSELKGISATDLRERRLIKCRRNEPVRDFHDVSISNTWHWLRWCRKKHIPSQIRTFLLLYIAFCNTWHWLYPVSDTEEVVDLMLCDPGIMYQVNY